MLIDLRDISDVVEQPFSTFDAHIQKRLIRRCKPETLNRAFHISARVNRLLQYMFIVRTKGVRKDLC